MFNDWIREDLSATYTVQASIYCDGAALLKISHFAHDRRDSTDTQSSSPSNNQFRKSAEKLPFG